MICFSYVSRVGVKDSTRHVLLGTQQVKPVEFALQINLKLENGWGILRCIIDICMKLKEGKYLILKDPNKVWCVCVFVCVIYCSEGKHLLDKKPCVHE